MSDLSKAIEEIAAAYESSSEKIEIHYAARSAFRAVSVKLRQLNREHS